MIVEPLSISHTEIVNDFLLLNWGDGTDSMIELKQLRNQCPCANCAGEKDALGNLYIGPEQTKTTDSYLIQRLEKVGHYALRPYWQDGHHSGIYSFEMLRILGENLVSE
tara:strand:+ start:92 stop:418 length:327 start_codon:yes stop_codon:yes gene_type:complete